MNATPLPGQDVFARIDVNIERPLITSARVKVGNNPVTSVSFVYLDLPFRVCDHCNRLGHIVEGCAVKHNFPLEDIYDEGPISVSEPESQSWATDFKVLINEQIERETASDAAYGYPSNFINPDSTLQPFKQSSSPSSINPLNLISSDEEEKEDDLLDQVDSILGKRQRYWDSPLHHLFSPSNSYQPISDLDFKTYNLGLLQDVVNQVLSSTENREDFIPLEDVEANVEDTIEEFFTPEEELSQQNYLPKPAFCITFSDSSDSITSSNQGFNSSNSASFLSLNSPNSSIASNESLTLVLEDSIFIASKDYF
ncbi:hypothetical protein MKW92_037637 [Papaver armeniacum]|nr:hypothetical protein MKW92_037637 [Papaver armeniacum]